MKIVPVLCDRCAAEADADWLEVTKYGDPEPDYVLGRVFCTTRGCVNVPGSMLVLHPVVFDLPEVAA